MGYYIPDHIRAYFRKNFKKCQICEKKFAKPENNNDKIDIQYLYNRMELHHIKKKSRGGTDEISNLMALCGHCHYEEHMNEITKSLFFSQRHKNLVKSIKREKIRNLGSISEENDMGNNKRRIYKINKMKSHYIGITWQSIDGMCHYTKVTQSSLVKFLEKEFLPVTQKIR